MPQQYFHFSPRRRLHMSFYHSIIIYFDYRHASSITGASASYFSPPLSLLRHAFLAAAAAKSAWRRRQHASVASRDSITHAFLMYYHLAIIGDGECSSAYYSLLIYCHTIEIPAYSPFVIDYALFRADHAAMSYRCDADILFRAYLPPVGARAPVAAIIFILTSAYYGGDYYLFYSNRGRPHAVTPPPLSTYYFAMPILGDDNIDFR